MKTYVMIASECYPKHHSKAGQETKFIPKIIEGIKKHTCRMNYEFWEKRASEINEKRAFLSIRSWNGLPYRSKQDEYCRMVNLGIERLDIIGFQLYVAGMELNDEEMIKLAYNDGFDKSAEGLKDFFEWLKIKKDTKIDDAAVLHFTDLRYGTV